MNEPRTPNSLPKVVWARVVRRRWPLVLSLLLAVLFVWLLERGALPVLPKSDALANAAWWVVPAYASAFGGVLLVRAVRWYWLLAPLERVPMARILRVSFVFYGALILLSFRMGEAVRPAMIRKKGGLSAWAATGTVAAERIIDGLVSSSMLFVALLWAEPLDPLPERIGALPVSARLVPGAAYAMVGLFFCALVTLVVFFRWRYWARRVTERIVGIVSLRAAHWLADKVDHIASGLGFLPRARYSLPFLAFTALYWLSNALALWLLMRGCGLSSATFAQACTVVGVLSLGLLVPSGPGFFGTFQLSVYAGLAMYFSAELIVEQGAVVVFWMYTVQVLLSLLLAAIGTVWEWRSAAAEAALPLGEASS